jgi:hypothetical protein
MAQLSKKCFRITDLHGSVRCPPPTGRRRTLGSPLALEGSMRRRISLAAILVMVFAIVPAVSALPIAMAVVPLALLEPGSLLLLGITFFILASVAQRALFS